MREDTEVIDYDALEAQAIEVQPKMIIGGGSAYPRQFDFARMRQIADKVGAKLLIDMAHFAGLVAGGAHPSPVPYADVVTTTTHKTLRGPRSGLILCKQEYAAGIDRSVFPGQQGGPLVHIVAAKAVAFHEALQPEFKAYAAQTVANAKALGEAMQAAGLPDHLRRHGHAPHPGGCVCEGHLGLGSGGGAGRGRHHGEQERDPVRQEPADEAERHPHRHTGADHARHERSGDAHDRHVDRRGAGKP